MDIEQATAAIAVSDIETAERWWTGLIGRQPDARPMGGLVEWHVGNAGLQLVADAERAGGSLATLRVTGLAASVDDLRARGIAVGHVGDTSEGPAFTTITDPDGNGVTLVEAS